MTTDERKEKVRILTEHINRNIREYMYENNRLEELKTIDPAKVDEFWNLTDWFSHACELYVDDKLPWDREIVDSIEVIQSDPESTPVSVKVKKYDFRPSVMQAARDLFVSIVLP